MKNSNRKAYQYGLKICMIYKKKITEKRLYEDTYISAISYGNNYSSTSNNSTEKNYIKTFYDDIVIEKFERTVKKICKIYPREGRVLKLRYIEDYQMIDIIQCMNISKSTCYRLRKKAVEELGKMYLKEEKESKRNGMDKKFK